MCALPHSSACTTRDDTIIMHNTREMVPVPTSMVLLLSVKAGLRAKDQLGT